MVARTIEFLLRVRASAPLVAMAAVLAAAAACDENSGQIITSAPPAADPGSPLEFGQDPDDVDSGISLPTSNTDGVVSGAPVAGDFSSCAQEALATPASGMTDAALVPVPVGPVKGLGASAPPVFGPTATAAVAPPPVSGGTLLALANGKVVVASDPDRDAVYVVDTVNAVLKSTIALQPGDEPGRLVEDGAGQVHVALRSGGALVTIDPVAGVVVTRRAVCPAPRGVAWDSTTDSVWVACATGELVALPAGGGPATKSFVIERDLRDVLVEGAGTLKVTEFRSAQILDVGTDGTILGRSTLSGALSESSAQVLWRAVLTPSHSILAVHQGHSSADVATHSPSGYGFGPAGPFGIVSSQVTSMGDPSDGGATAAQVLSQSVLPVDVAVAPDGSYAAVVSAGGGFSPAAPEVSFVALGLQSACTFAQPPPVSGPTGALELLDGGSASIGALVPEQAIAAAFDGYGHLLVQMREPASLRILPVPTCSSATGTNLVQPLFNPIGGTAVSLSSISRADTGHDIFHAAAGFAIACASCHPEGGDDGHIWILDGSARRTPSLRGTIAGTAPYHWPGDEADFPTLTADVYTGRMGGGTLLTEQTSALMQWVNAIPAPPAPSWIDSAAALRGNVVFGRGDTGCTTCHSGPKLTNNQTLNVGTCGLFQVPPLVGVGWRTPLMHNGCAATLADRLGTCATPVHVTDAQLSAGDMSDLVAYLESL